MPYSNPITKAELTDLAANNPLHPRDGSPNEMYMPPAYFMVPPATTNGPVKWRLFDAAYIQTGIIDPNRLGTGATGAGNLYLADDGTWKTVGGGGGGDMLKATYDVDNDGTVDSAERIEIVVRNSTGSTLTKGQVVYLSGATGNRPNALLSQADTEATSSKTIGIVVANINNNSDGYVAVSGTLHDLDTSAFADGDAVWLSAATAGAFTSTIPVEPNHTVFIGYIARSHPTQGRLVILIQNGYELNELHGVQIASEANNDLLTYESSTGLWKNKQISSVLPNGLLKLASAISTTFQVVKDYLDNVSVLFLNSRRVGIGKDTSVTTQSVAVVEVQDTNTSIVLKPNGTGGIIATIPDGTGVGGNARGPYSIELMPYRVGVANTAVASGWYSVMIGGQRNTASGDFSVVFGSTNTASSNYSVVSGGQSNTASTNTHATVVGGQSNTASGQWSLAGGQSSVASGTRSVALGAVATASAGQSFAFGLNTTVQGYGSVGIGHYAQTGTSADLAFASGSGRSYLYNQMSHGNYWFTDGGNANFGSRQLSQLLPYRESALTTAATMLLSLDGTGTTNLIIPLGNNRAWNVTIDTIAVVTAITGTATGVSVGDTYEEKATMSFKRVGGTSSLVALGSRQQIYDTSMATAIMNFSSGASQQLQIQFQAPTFAGGGSITCRVVSKVMLVEVAY